ncbi:homoserine kinase [Capilliphycus salinus ALCB114379]|uniref:homoserine kinase n=1 Tax=Capilliphycus salinus TaxID=2768948 RepID=UPI0039A77335
MSKSVTVSVPATTANLGPGFDCIGAALTLYNTFKISQWESPDPEQGENPVKIAVSGVDGDRVSTTPDNLAYQAFVRVYQHLGQSPPPVQMEINLGFPLARGLGSSATAIVGGLVGANAWAGSPLSQTEVMNLAIAMEGHPDNVVPALLGNCQLSVAASETDWEICEIAWHSSIIPIVAIPDFELSTAEARKVLPTEYSRSDAIFNTAHFGLLVQGLQTGKGKWLQVAMQDRIHQPYRQSLIIGYEAVQKAAIASGAYQLAISGAGPTLLALSDVTSAPDVALAMAEAWHEFGVKVEVRSLQIDSRGARVVEES